MLSARLKLQDYLYMSLCQPDDVLSTTSSQNQLLHLSIFIDANTAIDSLFDIVSLSSQAVDEDSIRSGAHAKFNVPVLNHKQHIRTNTYAITDLSSRRRRAGYLFYRDLGLVNPFAKYDAATQSSP